MDPATCLRREPMKAALNVPLEFDVSAAARDLGFALPVKVSRRLRESLLDVWSPCPCQDCETKALNVSKDRLLRMLKCLRAAIEDGDASQPAVEFTLDIPAPKCHGKRQLLALLATMRSAGSEGASVLITLAEEPMEAVPRGHDGERAPAVMAR